MKLNKLIKSRAYRNLRRYDQYHAMPLDIDKFSKYVNKLNLQFQEEIIGIYENDFNNMNSIVITTQGIHIFEAQNQYFVDYRQIIQARTPEDQEKLAVDELIISLQSGDEINISVSGGRGKTKDVWGILHFLNLVTKDIQRLDE